MKAEPTIPAGFTDVTAPAPPKAPVITVKDLDAPPPAPMKLIEPATSEPSEAPAPSEAQSKELATTDAPAEESKIDRAANAAKQARAAAKKNRELMAERSRLEQKAAYQAQTQANLQAQLDQANQHLRRLATNPLEAMRDLGVTTEQLAQRAALDGTPEGKISELQQQLQNYREEIVKMQQAQVQEQQRLRVAHEENQYKQQSQNPKKYPNLSTVHPDFILSRTKDLIRELKQRGHDPQQYSNHDLLSYLDGVYAGSKQPAPQNEQGATTGTESGKRPNTVTQRMHTAVSAAPPDFAKMSDREQRKWMAAQFAATMTTSK